jgi:hypothetical protein
MLRVFIEIVLTFLAPFLLYGLYRFFRPDPKEVEDAVRWRPYQWLALMGVLLVAASLVTGRLMTERHKGAYSPAVVKDGVLQPSRIE